MRFPVLYLLLLVLLLSGCLKPIPADPVLQEQFFRRPENLKLTFVTDKGEQVAYYLPPLDHPHAPPEKLNILYPGINSLALGWLGFIDLKDSPQTGYLLIEYPGRGLSEGTMRPEKNYLNTEGALNALARHFQLDSASFQLSLMGHSFGTGMALQFAAIRQVERVVLVAPFNDLKAGVRQQSWLLAAIMPSQIDSRKLIRQLLDSSDPPELSILHGAKDRVLPVTMGRELAQLDPRISYHEFAEDDHSSILTTQWRLIFGLLNGDE